VPLVEQELLTNENELITEGSILKEPNPDEDTKGN
jgi:hypothetical protein